MTPERKICWRVTRFCNLACLHCLAGHANATRSDLSGEEKIRAAELVAGVGLERITWTGGEPTLCPELPQLLRIMQGAGISNTITTHGLLLRDSLLANVNRDRDRLRFSFDGLRGTHNFLRNANVFDRTLRELARVQALGFRIEVNLSAMKCNWEDLPVLTRCLAEKGVESFVEIGLIRRESALDNHLEALSSMQFAELAEALSKTLEHFPGVGLRINDYTKEDDSYIVLESDGDIILSSELVSDRSFGLVTGDGGAQLLRHALNDHTLRHQKIFRKATGG